MTTNEQTLQALVAEGLGALPAGGRTARHARDSIDGAASYPDLKAALEESRRTLEIRCQRVDDARSALSDDDAGPDDDPVIEARFERARRIREQAPDDASRDLGIVAAERQALRCWIASFAAMGACSKALGEEELVQGLHESAAARSHRRSGRDRACPAHGRGAGARAPSDGCRRHAGRPAPVRRRPAGAV